MATVIVSGALANKPFNGGNAWTRLSWVCGLRKLGFDVLFVEELAQGNCVDSIGNAASFENSANLAYFRQVMEQFGLRESSALIFEGGKNVHGLSLRQLSACAKDAALLFNISGHLTQPEIRDHVACKVYCDDDPGFTQIWHAAGSGGARLDGHDFHFTIGENIGSADCLIPVGDIDWRHTRSPVVLDDWPVVPPQGFDSFTTVASWRGAYAPIQLNGKTLGVKAHEFRKFFELPRRSGKQFEVALQIHPADKNDLDALRANGWRITDPKQAAASTDDFRRYVQNSSAEFSVAQGVYVDTNSGWFSDRTVRYLASGRPALVQDTGFTRYVGSGEGLIPFRNVSEAVEGTAKIARNYEKHCRAARRVAEEFFDSDRIIGRLLKEIGIKP